MSNFNVQNCLQLVYHYLIVLTTCCSSSFSLLIILLNLDIVHTTYPLPYNKISMVTMLCQIVQQYSLNKTRVSHEPLS